MQGVLIVAALASKKMSLSVLIVAWGSIRKIGISSIVNNFLNDDMKRNGKFEHVRI